MSKIRVYELAKELNIESKQLITLLMDELNVEVKNHMSVIEDEAVELIRELVLGTADGTAKDITAETDGKKSLVDVYEDELADELNKGNKKKRKTKKQLAEEKARAEQEFADSALLGIGETILVKDLADMLQQPYNEVIKTSVIFRCYGCNESRN